MFVLMIAAKVQLPVLGCSCYKEFSSMLSFWQRGKTVPEELVKPEELSRYRQVASHVVSMVIIIYWEGYHEGIISSKPNTS